MKRLIFIEIISLFLAVMMTFNGCSSDSGGGGTLGTGTTPIVYPGMDFPDIDEAALLSETGKQVIETVASADSVVEIDATAREKVVLSTADVVEDNSSETGYLLVHATASISSSNIGNPLFIDDTFIGMITGVISQSSELKILVANAENINDVYGKLNIELQNSSIRRSVQRSIATHKIKGIYDDINVKPLHFTLFEKPVTNARGVVDDEIVLRMDIPKGYHIPIRQRSISCDFASADCSFTVEGNESERLDLGKAYENGGITFSTEGSYIEMGLGAYMKIHYDENLIAADVFDFTLAESGYFKSNMQVSVSGKLTKDWSTDLKLIPDFDIEIVHPYSAVVKTSIAVAPVVTFGVSGSLKGSISASSYMERSGEIRFQYDSTTDTKDFESTLKYTPKSLDKDAVTVEVQAEAHAYVFPSFLAIPNVKILRINMPLTLVYTKSGVKLDNAVNGLIRNGFVVVNGAEQDVSAAEVSVVTTLSGAVQGRWMVKVGSLDFYHSDAYVNLFRTSALTVLEWKSQLLKKPQVIVKEDASDPQVRNITFDADESKAVKEKLYFYYTVANSNETQYDIDPGSIESHSPYWKIGDAPVVINSNKIIKVRSVLYNKDISSAKWSWGTSVSEQTTSEVTTMMKPIIDPSSSAFKEHLTVSITQPQGYAVYYRIDGGTPQLYSTPIDLTQSTSLSAYASAMIDGRKILSEEATATYTMCASDEDLIGGSCVEHEDPTMMTPTATPMDPEFTESIDVVLSSPEGGVIFYSVDGGEWQEYTAPITLSDSATIYAYADSDPSDPEALYSEVAVFSYSKVEGGGGSSSEGSWTLSETIIYVDPEEHLNSNPGCYHNTLDLSSGSATATNSVVYPGCNWDYAESVTFTGSWSVPPATLVPGTEYAVSATISRSNPVEQWGADDFIGLDMDKYDVACYFGTAGSVDLIDRVSVGWRATDPSSASESGTFTAPAFGYASSTETNKFQIKASTHNGCVRYIYQWNN